MAETKRTEGKNAADEDPYWWTPWAVLAGLVLFGLLGYLGKLGGGQHGGPTAADVTETPPAASAK